MIAAVPSDIELDRRDGADSLVKLTGVSKSYSKAGSVIPVLKGIDLTIAEGEFVAVVGPSGTGKSTLLHLVAGLDLPDAGYVTVAGERISDMSERLRTVWRSRSVGFVFQQFHLIPVLTAAENVELPLTLFRMSRPERRRRVGLALDLVGLSDRGDHRPGQLSGGQEQRVAIARAIITDPALILADEPTGDLDADSAARSMQLLSSLAREMGKTIVMVTHDSLAADCATRCCRIDRGAIEELPRMPKRAYGISA